MDTTDADNFWRHIVQIAAMAALIMLLATRDCIVLYALRFDKVPQHTSILSGQDWIDELIAGHNGRFYNKMGIKKHVFWSLLSLLWTDTGLHDSRNVSSEEQLVIFLHYVH